MRSPARSAAADEPATGCATSWCWSARWKTTSALIAASFREHRLTYFVDARRSATHHPLLQWVRAVFAIARKDWPRESVIELMKSRAVRDQLRRRRRASRTMSCCTASRSRRGTSPSPGRGSGSCATEDEPGRGVRRSRADQGRRDPPQAGRQARAVPARTAGAEGPDVPAQICSELFKVFEAFGIRQIDGQMDRPGHRRRRA